MTARKLLEEVRWGYGEMAMLIDRKNRIRNSLMPKAQQIQSDRVQTSPPLDPMGEIEGDVDELDKEIRKKMRLIVEKQKTAEGYIDKLNRPEMRQCLTGYYITGICHRDEMPSWGDVAKRMGYSYDGIRKLKRKSLQEMDAVMCRDTQERSREENEQGQ